MSTSPLERQIVSRRRFLGLGLGGVATVPMLAACSQPGAPAKPPAPTAPAAAPTAPAAATASAPAPTAPAAAPAKPTAPPVAATAAPATKSPVTVAWQLGWTKSVQFGGFFAAIEKGFYEQEGIKPDVRPGGPQIDPIAIVAGGSALIGDAGGLGVIKARAEGVPIKSFMALFQKSPFCVMSMPDKPIKTLSDFAGRTVALPTGAKPQIEALLKKGGVDLNTVTFVPVGVDPALLTSGQVDGYFGYATNQGIILKERGFDVVTAYTYDLGLKEYGNTYFVADSKLPAEEETLTGWLRATIKGFEYAVQQPEEVARWMVEKYGIQGLELKQQTSESKAQIELYTSDLTKTKGLLYMDTPVWKEGVDLALNDFGVIQKPVEVADVATLKILERAYDGKAKLLS